MGGGGWQVHNELTHCFSESVREQMLDCLVKYTQTPYQILDVMDPAGRQRLLAFSSPLNVHARKCMESVRIHMHGGSYFFERAVVCAQYHHSDSSQRIDEERMIRSFWGNSRKMAVKEQ